MNYIVIYSQCWISSPSRIPDRDTVSPSCTVPSNNSIPCTSNTVPATSNQPRIQVGVTVVTCTTVGFLINVKTLKNSSVAYNMLFSAENLKVSADVYVRSNSTERKAIISMSSMVFTTSIRSFREGNLEGVLVDRGVPVRAAVPDSSLSTPSAPRHVETCSTWTSLYRDPLRPIDMFRLVH